jgi:S-DNA-T family DNA segregation ATPase FtsK/SpoIIIE
MASRRGLQLDVFALSLLGVGLLATLCVLGHDPVQASGAAYPPAAAPEHPLGPTGAALADQLYQTLGWAVYVLLAAWFVLVLVLLQRRGLATWLARLTGWALLVPCAAVVADAVGPEALPGPLAGSGGTLGAWAAAWLEDTFTDSGRVAVTVACCLLAVTLTAGPLLRRAGQVGWRCTRWLLALALRWALGQTRGALQGLPFRAAPAVAAANAAEDEVYTAEFDDDRPAARTIPINRPQMPALPAAPAFGIRALLGGRKAPPIVRPAPQAVDYSGFQLPPVTLLEEPKPFPYEAQDQRLREQAAKLEQTFTDFSLNVRVVGINTGPVITQYEIALETGLRVNKVTCMADDLALNLRVPSVRIVAPIPGKNTVGIEVPNERRAEVRLKEVMLTAGPKVQQLNIPLFLGKDTEGQSLVYDLADMPHLLIAGRTGTGKSVCLNAIILSILMTRRPDQVKLIMIDPKMTELIEYGKIPHLMHPVVRDAKKAEAILAWAVDKMEERYDLLSRARVRNIASYNQLTHEEILARLKPDEEERERIPAKMPSIVIIVDEMADLMMTSKREVEGHVIRLAQKSRAAGIHLVVATQKPTVDVITGLIKSNLPARISFQVSSRTDSRVVLDEMGADKLLGKGDMLFLQPGTSTLLRGQGTYASDVEITRVVEHLKCDPCFDQELLEVKSTGDGGGLLERLRADSLYEQAAEIVIREGRGSVSLLQRTLGIGYGRAARLIDFMAQDGLVGAYNGSNAREVLCSLERWEELKLSRQAAAS